MFTLDQFLVTIAAPRIAAYFNALDRSKSWASKMRLAVANRQLLGKSNSIGIPAVLTVASQAEHRVRIC